MDIKFQILLTILCLCVYQAPSIACDLKEISSLLGLKEEDQSSSSTEEEFTRAAKNGAKVLVNPSILASVKPNDGLVTRPASHEVVALRKLLSNVNGEDLIYKEKYAALESDLLAQVNQIDKKLSLNEKREKRAEFGRENDARCKEIAQQQKDAHKNAHAALTQIDLGCEDLQKAFAFIQEIQEGLNHNDPKSPPNEEGLYGAKFYYNEKQGEEKRAIAVVKSLDDAAQAKSRGSISAKQTVANEAMAYMFDRDVFNSSYGVLETYVVEMPLLKGKMPCLASAQRFFPNSKTFDVIKSNKDGNDISSIPAKAFEALNLHLLIGNIDGNLGNVLWNKNTIGLIDNGLAFPGAENQNEYRCDWIIFKQAYEEMSQEQYDRLAKIDIPRSMNIFEKCALHLERMNADFAVAPDKYLTQMLRLELGKKVAEHKLSQAQWFRTMSALDPLTYKHLGSGGEIENIYAQYIHIKTETDWRKIAARIDWVQVRKELDKAAARRHEDTKY